MMEDKLKLKISIMINIVLLISLFMVSANVVRYYNHNMYHRAKMLKFQYESRFKSLYPINNLNYFKQKWGNELKMNKEGFYKVDFKIIQQEPFFINNNFDASYAQIQSLNLQFDRQGNLIQYDLEEGP